MAEYSPMNRGDAEGAPGEMRRSWVARGRYRLAANERPGREPAFVLMHGFPDDSHLWDALIPELEDRRVVMFDFLGWGESDKPQEHDYTFEGQMADLEAVIEHFGLDRVELVGHDSSVPTALDWALDHPDRAASVTVMNGFYINGGAMRPPALIAILAFGQLPADVELTPAQPAGITRGMNALGERLEDDEETFLSLWRWQQRMFFAREEDADRFIPLFERQFTGPNSARAPLRSLTADIFGTIASHEFCLDELERLEVPVNVVWGGLDEDLAVGQARRIRDVVPLGRLVVIDDAHHNVPIDAPADVASVLLGKGSAS